jgi:UDP-hydrolysing UDP-N-acetyl-D-glucosamine 2-epimerase
MARLAEAISRIDPDGVLLVGDRYETFAAASAAYLCHVPVAHCHGGEITRGAMDDALRHAITKLSHVHFASTEQYAGRIRQLGEEPWRVHVSGAPGLDTLRDAPLLSGAELAPTIGYDPSVEPTAVLTYHPATLADEAPGATFELLARALEMRDLRVVITGPNADPGSEEILAGIRAYTARSDRAMHAPSLGHLRYMSLLACAACMVGNSSSGIIEAGSFALPVVNVGRRQEGRTSGPNVIHVEADAAGIKRGIDQALSDETRQSLEGMENPYGSGRSWEKILNVLGRLPSREALLCKGFSDWTGGE